MEVPATLLLQLHCRGFSPLIWKVAMRSLPMFALQGGRGQGCPNWTVH